MKRVRRRLLQEAVADNLDTIRGLPPRALRPRNRIWQAFLRRGPLLLVPLTLVASTYFAAGPGPTSATPAIAAQLPVASASVVPTSIPSDLARMMFPEPPLQRVDAAAFPLAVKRVILDAGHGGSDPGATALELREKDITLDIGDRLRSLLKSDGYEVVTTRDGDLTVPLRDRAQLANESRGDIFVSIHVNAIVKHTASRGVETYYLGPTNDPSLTRLAAAENSGSGYALADLRKLLDGVYADARRDESRELARAVQNQMFRRLGSQDAGLENWGVKRAPFLVLVATDMPAVLAEVGCLSNQKEAKMLGKPEYRQKIAEALYHGIHAYASANDAPQKKGI